MADLQTSDIPGLDLVVFRRWYDAQRPEPFAAAWRAAKAALDPDGRLNPGVLWEQP